MHFTGAESRVEPPLAPAGMTVAIVQLVPFEAAFQYNDAQGLCASLYQAAGFAELGPVNSFL